ncbi:cytokine receptor [Drosophila mojavensis]|uniref:Fibronectin type-III domain-containing protein n=1 Tax=Drosophila mojavensis TaxID=7230 RepID=B4L7Z5_DROMO|nr:cytokine receptor [Drosophila mojavensis]EDW05570.2 uncharacterized protein Dmoj_GI11020 [Drosophila mojavensis]
MQINDCKETKMQQITFALAIILACCIVGLNGQPPSPGWVVPEKAEVPVGSDLNITCTINQAFFDSSKTNETCRVNDLYFKANINDAVRYFNGSDLQIINETTIMMSFKNMSDQEGEYLCMCKEMGMFSSKVDVGTKPLPVQDFNCTSYDWDYMFCNFTEPRNSINTKYNISFTTDKNTNYRYYVDCNFDAAPVVNCNITSEQYKKFSQIYFFRLDIANTLGNASQDIEVNNVERMVLARPGQNLKLLNRTKDSICLSWETPRRSNFVGGVLWRVFVTPENFPTLVRPMWRNNSSAAKDTLCLTELPYPGYNYLLELRVRNNKTKSRWSPPLNYEFRTAAERPARPPRVTNGSFYVYSSESSLTLYWEQLQKHEMNGDNFTYVISEIRCNDTISDASKIKVDTNSATIDNWKRDAHYEVFIRSSNIMGTSLEASRLYIPSISSEDRRLRMPLKIQGVYHSSNSSYTLGWKPPKNTSGLIDYTVFWCNAKPALLSKCNGTIHFEHVSPDRLEYSTASGQSPSLNMAVSANFVGRNTGMHWVTCTGDGNDDLAKMDPAIGELTDTSITVKWGTEGVCAAILSGYNLTYCKRSDGKPDNCTTMELPKDATSYKIMNLEPYTFYTIKMSMYSPKRASKYSDELFQRTAQGAPTPPRQLMYLNVTNSSVHLAWKQPIKANGMLVEYRGSITHDNTTNYFDVPTLTAELVNNEKHYVLNNLTAYTEYEISLRAKTIHYSEPSNTIRFRTAVGLPSPPTKLHVENSPWSTVLEWKPPSFPAGRLEFYEVVIIERNANNTIIGQPFSYVSARPNLTCVMKTPLCTPLHRFTYKVRAVNAEILDPMLLTHVDKTFTRQSMQSQKCDAQPPLTDSEWSDIQNYLNSSLYRLYKSAWTTHDVSCSPGQNNFKVFVTSVEVATSIIFFCAFAYMAYRKLLKMSDIDLVLPPGIDETRKKPIDHGSNGGGTGGSAGGGVGIGIIATRLDLPHYSQHDLPQDFSSGNESSKLLLANSSSGGMLEQRDAYEERTLTTLPPSSYMSMSQGLLLDDDSQMTATELQSSSQANPNLNANSNPNPNPNAGGYIKPTQMKNWTTPSSMANTLPSTANGQLSMPLSGYVPVQVLQSRPTNAPAATAPAAAAAATAATQAPMHLLNTSNYVQAADLHKLKPLAPMSGVTGPAMPTTLAATPLMMPNGFGYTAMEQLQRNGLIKPTPATAAVSTAQQSQQTPQRLQPNIGGYVTPQDLNALAHNRHML